MILGKKVRLIPTNYQEKIFWKSVGAARFVYNWAITAQEEEYKNSGKFISDSELRKMLTRLKKTKLTWLNEVSSSIPRYAITDVCNNYKFFFNHNTNKPKLKSKKKSKKSFRNANDRFKVKEGKLVFLEKIGWVKTSEQIPVGLKYYNPRVSFDEKYWYLSVGIEREEIKEELTDEVLGIDLGIKNLAVCSNGKIYKNINKSRVIKKIEKKLRRLQRQISRKYLKNKKGNRYQKTHNITKLEKKIKLLYRKLTNIRENYIHQITTELVKTKPAQITIENLNIKGMMKNRHLSKAIANQKFYEFRRQLEYKCKFVGIKLVIANRFYPSSKTCSNCGYIKKDLKLKDRVFDCPNCRSKIDRDLNAALNLSMYQN